MHEPAAAADASRILSIVIPVRNEADNVVPLAREIVHVLAGRRPFEIIFVDGASTDRTARNIRALRQASVPQVRPPASLRALRTKHCRADRRARGARRMDRHAGR